MSGSGGFMSGAAAGGLLGLLLGVEERAQDDGRGAGIWRRGRVGALALKAYQNYQSKQGQGRGSASAP